MLIHFAIIYFSKNIKLLFRKVMERKKTQKNILLNDNSQKALTAVCGKSDCLNTPFVTRTFHYILGICNHKYTLYYLVYPYLFFIKCIFMS